MIIILDFNDSFTWNISRYFYQQDEKTEVWSYPQKYLEMKNKLNSILENGKKIVLVWGPGPGQPHEYPEYQKLLKWALRKNEIYHLGICLGHQMIGQEFSFKLKYLGLPMHGKRWSFVVKRLGYFKHATLNQFSVQSYNSMYLCFDKFQIKKNKHISALLVIDNRIESIKWQGGISYQFHPESVGTSCPDVFFRPIFDFLYNSRDGLSD